MREAARILLVLGIFFEVFGPALGTEIPHLRLGQVKSGTAAWETDTVRRHDFDRAAGIVLDTVDLANPAAGEVALQAGGVDAILTDWLWVSRQRQAGQNIIFIPHTAALGEILVPNASSIRTLGDLDGKRLGVAGGPLDKSWLLLRAYSRRVLGHDLADRAEAVYAAPPLLSRELAAGRIDAVLTYWPFAARLTVRGFRSLASMSDIMKGLGFSAPVPMLGYALSESWIARHPGGIEAFLAATGKADAVMAESDDEWERLGPLTAAEDHATLVALRERFRGGIVAHWGAPERTQILRLFALLAETGSADLTGGSAEIAPGTFWPGSAP